LSLGVETIDGNFSVIIPKNTPLPIKRTQRYTTDTPSENSIKIKIYQGERLIANKNTLIGEFIFDKISIGGVPQIDITFKVDSNSIITVIITDKKSGIEKNILIKNIAILNDDEIEQIINLANSNNKLDEEEMTKYNRIYLLNTKIEIAMNNITLNYLLDENKKKEILNELCQIESEIALADNVKLLKLLTIIDEKYLNLTQNNIDSLNNSDYSDLEKLMLIELKNELNSKIIFLLNKNSEWDEYLTPIIEKLTLANISLEYIQDKLEIIKELEDEDENIILYKDQFKTLCLFIKNQIEEDIISLDTIKMNDLIILVNNSLHLIDNDNNTNDKDWEIKLMDFNKKCEEFLNF
jgi:hypothetical protein